jgi:hypothetical protein
LRFAFEEVIAEELVEGELVSIFGEGEFGGGEGSLPLGFALVVLAAFGLFEEEHFKPTVIIHNQIIPFADHLRFEIRVSSSAMFRLVSFRLPFSLRTSSNWSDCSILRL